MSRSVRALLPLWLALLLLPAAAQGQRYAVIEGARVGDDPDTIEVIEFFWYGCPHCERFRPHIEQWKQAVPEGVSFRHLPAVLSPRWEVHAKAFFAARAMGVLDTFHGAMFDAIHRDGRRLDNATAIGEFVQSLGIDGEQFVATMQSFAVDSRIRRVKNLQRAYGVSGTPTVVIDGRYRTSGNLAGSVANMIPVIDERIAALRSGAD
ncbi:MAG: thiol:disulfide interchange protein DsbA/DsbL [Halofilum sp. (in: g-proteobacteria)]|nr:thiol:disulfide interchange protein DsbA/DsbL [Halofilum sp. (in: g-proteobacteria)]